MNAEPVMVLTDAVSMGCWVLTEIFGAKPHRFTVSELALEIC
jgi:hypothetical protein